MPSTFGSDLIARCIGSGSTRAGRELRSAHRPARRASAAGRATADSTLPRTTRRVRRRPGRGCRTPRRRARPVRRRDNRSRTRRRRRPRGRPSVSCHGHARVYFPPAICGALTKRLVAPGLLHDRHEPRVEEAELEEHQERHGAVDVVRERVDHRAREVEPERQLDERLHGHRLVILLVLPVVLRRARCRTSACA